MRSSCARTSAPILQFRRKIVHFYPVLLRFSSQKAHTSAMRKLPLFLFAAGMALAGPPLICHPFSIGNDPSLPFGKNWNSPDPKYDTRNLAADTLKLLDSGQSVLTRMETMRRAA